MGEKVLIWNKIYNHLIHYLRHI